MGATIAYETFVYLYKAMILSSNIEMWVFIKILIVETLYNGIFTIILYPLMRKLGYKIEDLFKNPQILTRYF